MQRAQERKAADKGLDSSDEGCPRVGLLRRKLRLGTRRVLLRSTCHWLNRAGSSRGRRRGCRSRRCQPEAVAKMSSVPEALLPRSGVRWRVVVVVVRGRWKVVVVGVGVVHGEVLGVGGCIGILA